MTGDAPPTDMSSRPLKEEFTLARLGLGHPNPGTFVSSQWRIPRWGYLLWRALWFFYHIGLTIASGVDTEEEKARYSGEGVKWFIYLPYITLLLTAFTCFIDFLVVFYAGYMGLYIEDDKIDDGNKDSDEVVFRGEFFVESGLKEITTPWYMKVVWIFYNIINSSNILVTIIYWAVDFDGSADAIDVLVHTVNTVFVLLNTLVTAMPVQILHFIYPAIYAAAYFLFTLIYHEAGGTDIRGRDVIYTPVEWYEAYPTAVSVPVGLFVAVPLTHLGVFALYTFRVYLHSRINSDVYPMFGSGRDFDNAVNAGSSNGRDKCSIEMTSAGSPV